MSQQTILDRILSHKREEVARQKIAAPLGELRRQAENSPRPRPFADALRRPGGLALIAEVKRASPSKGLLAQHFDAQLLAGTYAENGAAAISVLTDERFFQGSLQYLKHIRQLLSDRSIPLLRKDFIIDPYQVIEARAYGADAILLIVAALDDETLNDLLNLARTWELEALVEVHDEAELKRALDIGAEIIGINNRDLRTFNVDLATTRRLVELLPRENRPVVVAESGITGADDLHKLRAWGADAILVGEALVTAPDIAAKVRELADTWQPSML